MTESPASKASKTAGKTKSSNLNYKALPQTVCAQQHLNRLRNSQEKYFDTWIIWHTVGVTSRTSSLHCSTLFTHIQCLTFLACLGRRGSRTGQHISFGWIWGWQSSICDADTLSKQRRSLEYFLILVTLVCFCCGIDKVSIQPQPYPIPSHPLQFVGIHCSWGQTNAKSNASHCHVVTDLGQQKQFESFIKSCLGRHVMTHNQADHHSSETHADESTGFMEWIVIFNVVGCWCLEYEMLQPAFQAGRFQQKTKRFLTIATAPYFRSLASLFSYWTHSTGCILTSVLSHAKSFMGARSVMLASVTHYSIGLQLLSENGNGAFPFGMHQAWGLSARLEGGGRASRFWCCSKYQSCG